MHVVERRNRDTESAHFADRARIIAIETHQRRQIKSGTEAGLSLSEEKLEAFIGLPRRAEASELPHSPQTAAIQRRMHATSVRVLAGIAEIDVGIEAVETFRRVQRLDGHAADRGWRLFALRCRSNFLFPAFAGGAVGDGGHDPSNYQPEASARVALADASGWCYCRSFT